VEPELAQLALVQLRALAQQRHDEAVDRRHRPAPQPRQPGWLDRAQRQRVIGAQRLDRPVAHDLVERRLEQPQQRRRRQLPRRRERPRLQRIAIVRQRELVGVAHAQELGVLPDLRRDPRRGAVAGRIVPQHLDGERRVRLQRALPEQPQVAPRPAPQVSQRAAADLAALVRRGLHRVEAIRQHAEQREVVAILGALVDRLGRLPHAPLHRRVREHVQQHRAAVRLAALVQVDQDLAEPQPRRCKRRRLGLGERRPPRQLALGRGLVRQPARRHRGRQPVQRHRARRYIDGLAVVVAVTARRQLAAAILRIALRQVAHDQLAELGIARSDRPLHVTERHHGPATNVLSPYPKSRTVSGISPTNFTPSTPDSAVRQARQ
jgi:hypothetical protein